LHLFHILSERALKASHKIVYKIKAIGKSEELVYFSHFLVKWLIVTGQHQAQRKYQLDHSSQIFQMLNSSW